MKWYQADLCYCQNIHPGNTWGENFGAIETYANRVKDIVCPDEPFGLGLRLSALAAQEILSQINRFKSYLKEHNMYVFTINGFPYGKFHGEKIKENVYHPDWSQPERLQYTIMLADILAELLTESAYGSISTLPLCYGKQAKPVMIENVVKAARHLAHIHSKTGKTIMLGLEPEPDCCLETTPETIGCIKQIMNLDPEAGQFVGACIDTCHLALQQEAPLESIERLEKEEIRIAKIQISSSPAYYYNGEEPNQLQSFDDPVYLHQTYVYTENGVRKYRDLPEALSENPCGKWLVHFHVPLYYEGAGGLETTSGLLNRDYFQYLKNKDYHLEIETYSFGQIPEHTMDIVESISREYWFIMEN